MRNSLVFIFLIITSSIIELSVIHSLSYPLFLIPLSFAVGVFLFHTLPVSFGVLWFLLLPFVLATLGPNETVILPYWAVAVIGPILALRVLTRRSLYALIGLGIMLLFIFVTMHGIMNVSLFASEPWLRSFFFMLIELIISLITGFILVQKVKPIGSLFITKRKP